MLTRRRMLSTAAGAAATLAAPAVLGQSKPRVLVIGGGPAGATAARYIARDGQGAVSVTLADPIPIYSTCFHSNLALGGFKTYPELEHDGDRLAASGVAIVRQSAEKIDRERRVVTLSEGAQVGYDRLIMAPGIALDFESLPGWGSAEAGDMPHGWRGGVQTTMLRRKLNAVPDGGTIIIIAPPNPYRCPPGPYERASMMAHVLMRSGKTRCKILILDHKESFSKQALFQEGWEAHYGAMIEWLGPRVHDGIKSVDVKTMTVTTGFETYRHAPLVNVIPRQTAGRIAIEFGLADATGFCPIDPATMKSRLDPNIFVVGDAAIAGDMPKSAFAANSQAKVAAMAALADLTGARLFPARYFNTCWSLIDTDDAVKVGGRYEPKDGRIAAVETFISQKGEDAALRKANAAENIGWYQGLIADMLG